MLARVLRLPGKALGVLFGALLLAHAGFVIVGFHEAWFRPNEWQRNAFLFAVSLALVLVGRLFLSFLPPGPTGTHDLDGLPETWAASLGLGWLCYVLSSFLQPLGLQVGVGRWGIPALIVLLLAGLRWLTLPGAMVPRHRAGFEPFWPGRAAFVVFMLAWCACTLITQAFTAALAWVALAIVLERALARARRAAPERILLCGALVFGPGSDGPGLRSEFGVAAALGLGAAYLIPWLRCADKRAGVLAAVFFSSVNLVGWDPLALVGSGVLLLSSHQRQRRIVLLVTGCATLLFTGLRLTFQSAMDPSAASAIVRPRGRALLVFELLDRAGERGLWGLAWPILALALFLGALSFRWRTVAWAPGKIEEPLREARALCALLVLTAGALALPISPWFEGEALVILFPLAALLAGLLLLPAEQCASVERES